MEYISGKHDSELKDMFPSCIEMKNGVDYMQKIMGNPDKQRHHIKTGHIAGRSYLDDDIDTHVINAE